MSVTLYVTSTPVYYIDQFAYDWSDPLTYNIDYVEDYCDGVLVDVGYYLPGVHPSNGKQTYVPASAWLGWSYGSSHTFYKKLIPSETGIEEVSNTVSFTKTALPSSDLHNPTPTDGSTGVDFSGLVLSWDNDGTADFYNVYISETLVASPINTNCTVSLSQVPIEQVVTWTVHAMFNNSVVDTATWTFDPRPSKATVPYPEDADTDITTDLDKLEWQISPDNATLVDVYFQGIKIVEDQNAGILSVGPEIFRTLGHYLTTFSWSVDTKNSFGTTIGDTWTFTTLPFQNFIGSYTLLPDTGIPGWTGSAPDYSTGDGVNSGGVEGLDFTWNSFNGIIPNISKLCAAAASTLWYEDLTMGAGEMVELSAAHGEIDTSEQVDLVSAYQKVFVLNGENLKVADFINTKLTHTELTTAHLHSDVLTQDQGSGKHAYMVVDFTESGKTATYGFAYYDGGATAFDTSNSVTGSTGTTFTPSAVTAGPLWYDYTVYAGDADNYGTMPDNAYLGCLYRGRIVISGNPRAPHQWWMSKVGMPWKFLKDDTNDGPLTALSFTNAKVGEIGDIVTALIPYKDDLLIFGCANSLWLLIGDPASNGQLVQITNTTGIWGGKSWCVDNNSILYFLGNDGLYRMPVSTSFSPPENISSLVLPNLIKDWALNKALHRVTMAFDPINYGLVISKLDITSGVNLNYWFDLTTQGFYPETYPEECAPYSMIFYPAMDNDYKTLLMGCKDGYIRQFDISTKNDDVGLSTEAISSYVGMVEHLTEDDNTFGKLQKISAIVAGGESGGSNTDSDAVTWSCYRGNDAETVLERIKDGETPFVTGTWSTTGKQDWNRVRLRGVWAGIKLSNSTANKTWVIEKVMAEIIPAGKGR